MTIPYLTIVLAPVLAPYVLCCLALKITIQWASEKLQLLRRYLDLLQAPAKPRPVPASGQGSSLTWLNPKKMEADAKHMLALRPTPHQLVSRLSNPSVPINFFFPIQLPGLSDYWRGNPLSSSSILIKASFRFLFRAT